MSNQNLKKIVVEVVSFLQETYAMSGKDKAVIAVSGGVDSAVALTLLTNALGPENVFGLMMPYDNQNMDHARLALKFNKIPKKNWREIQIKPIVDQFVTTLSADRQSNHLSKIYKNFSLSSDQQTKSTNDLQVKQLRLGNIMARSRMIVVYDTAKELNALVCGTENKSEKYLAYYTRFGDEASDVEPIQDLFKTQVWQLARQLNLPEIFIQKKPSAELWQNQTDEAELGFSYQQADSVIEIYLKDNTVSILKISEESKVPSAVVTAVLDRVIQNDYKRRVPYLFQINSVRD
jgi:NAD+ synthase